jgi:hypothetical protein
MSIYEVTMTVVTVTSSELEEVGCGPAGEVLTPEVIEDASA